MKIEFQENRRILTQPIRFILYFVLGLIFAVFQTVGLDLISIADITPDLLLLLTIWIAMKEGRLYGMIAAFVLGLMLDIIAFDTLGSNALTKTIAAFIAGSFHKEGFENEQIANPTFLIITFFASVIHNVVYYLFYVKFADFSYYNLILRYGLAFSAYTVFFAIFPMIIAKPMKRYE